MFVTCMLNFHRKTQFWTCDTCWYYQERNLVLACHLHCVSRLSHWFSFLLHISGLLTIFKQNYTRWWNQVASMQTIPDTLFCFVEPLLSILLHIVIGWLSTFLFEGWGWRGEQGEASLGQGRGKRRQEETTSEARISHWSWHWAPSWTKSGKPH